MENGDSVDPRDPAYVPVRVDILEEQVDALGNVLRETIGLLGMVTVQAFGEDALALTPEQKREHLQANHEHLKQLLERLETAWKAD